MAALRGLLKHGGFASLLAVQFLGAFNDNSFRAIVSLAALTVDSSSRSLLVATAGAIFVLPYLLLSVHAGWLADRFSKRHVIVAAKWGELLVMLLALPALLSGTVPGLLAVLFLLGAQSAIFSPAKLGAIPEILPETELSRANGLMELVTFMAIILGTVGGGLLFTTWGASSPVPASVLIGLAVLGVALSFKIPGVAATGERHPIPINVPARIAADLRAMAGRRALFLTVLGVAWFWFLGMVFQLNVLVYARDVLGLGDRGVVVLNACVSVGIGVGAVVAGKLSGDMVELGLVPLGSIGMGLFALMLGLFPPSPIAAGIVHGLLGMAAGFFIVPLDAYLQQRAKPGERGRIIGASNFLAFTGVILGSGWIALTGGLLGWSPTQVLLATGLLSLAATAYILWLLPDFLVRLILWVVTHTIYRITVKGPGAIPRRGGALLVCNHISFVDALLVGTCTQRFVSFLIYRPIYEARGLNWFFKMMRGIPVSEKDGRKGVAASLAAARERLLAGELVCIFAEGSISRTGNLLRFRKGFETIVKETGAPVVPIHLDGVWGSIFSYQGGRFLWKWPRAIPYPVTISIGDPMPSTARAWEVRQAVMQLSADAFDERKSRQKPLHVTFIQTARRFLRRPCVADSTGLALTFFGALAGTLALSRVLRRRARAAPVEEEKIGILLPPCVPAALLNAAALMAGTVPVNLNYTTSSDSIDSAIARCGIRTVITSRRFLEKLGFAEREGMVMVEDLMAEIGPGRKLLFATLAAVVPARLLTLMFVSRPRSERGHGPMDDLATIIFSSGSTATPKGVMLTHHNIVSNVEGMQQIFDIAGDDRMIGVLPFFHSFGFTATLWLPLMNGFGVVYHMNPFDAKVVGRLCRTHRITFLLATPTFLQSYLRRCTPEDFALLRYVVVGAEKLKEPLAAAFKEKFGVEPLEGYGATELSPAATMSMPDFKEPGNVQIGHKLGSIGQPLPGVAARVVDLETFADRPVETEGLLLVRGASVMKGYLDDPAKTAEVMRDGWYITGDIARFDQDGFITLTDRLSRFAKIAGEMVPLGAVEDAIQEALGVVERCCVVAALPDADKGERLVVLYAAEDFDPAAVLARLSQSGLPNLWIPKREGFHRIESIPLLGTGKIDLKRIKDLALALAAEAPS